MLLGLYQDSFKYEIISFAANRRRKGMVIILYVCLCVRKNLRKATGRLHCILISIILFTDVGLQQIFAPFGYSFVILVFECVFSIRIIVNVCACAEIEHVKL